MAPTLQSLNDSFCSGAESLRYINQRIGEKGAPYQFFSNTVVPSSPEEGSWLRSVKFDNMNSYLFHPKIRQIRKRQTIQIASNIIDLLIFD